MDDVFRRLREQEEMMRRLTEGPLKSYLENEESVRRMVDAASGIDITALAGKLAGLDIDALVGRMAAASTLTDAAFARLARPEFITAMERAASLHLEVERSIGLLAVRPSTLASQIDVLGGYIDATRFAIASIDYERIGGLINAAAAESTQLARSTDKLVSRHAEFLTSVGSDDEGMVALPPGAFAMPTLDVFVHTAAVRSVTPHEPLQEDEEQETASLHITVVGETHRFLEDMLPRMSLPFLDQYRGARARSLDRGADWWTQGSASMRKLLKGVLHTAAPNERVLPWALKNKKSLDRNGRPTRATKIAWLCRTIGNDAYREFVRTELESALALITLVDAAQHVDEFPEFEQQYDWTILRVEVAIRHILVLWMSRGSVEDS